MSPQARRGGGGEGKGGDACITSVTDHLLQLFNLQV